MDYTKQLQDIVQRLFSEEKIDLFIGYRKPETGEADLPLLIHTASEIHKLVFTNRSVYNITNYLKDETIRKKRAGLVVKGCDSRALMMLITEQQVKRENLFIVGIACEGMLDDLGQKEQRCTECVMPDPVVFDEMIGDPQGKQPYRINPDVEALWAMPLPERAAHFEGIFSRCIRCNACRHSCPLCYCTNCAIDQETSVLFQGSNTTSAAFHALMTWSLHLAGRCVDCRNCERACSEHLPLHLLHKQNEQVIYANFQEHLAGMKPDHRGAFYTYSLDDPNDFIL
jgi:formate dehydrogenase (coenzyme F420) beta subunit